MALSRNVLIVIGVLSLAGAAFTGATWWAGLTPVAQMRLVSQALAWWFCCGGPLAGGVAGWQINQWRRHGWRRAAHQSEEL